MRSAADPFKTGEDTEESCAPDLLRTDKLELTKQRSPCNVRKVAKPIKRTSCSVCSAQIHPMKVSSHMFREHGVKCFACDKCDMKFVLQCKLNRHKESHNPRKENLCTICNKLFQSKESLHMHVKRHTQPLIRPACDICHKEFAATSGLRTHMQTHLGQVFTCSKCGKTFSRASYLKLHLLIHAERSRPFACDKCPATFILHQTFKDHASVHITERAISCFACSGKFKSKLQLRRHQKQMHSEVKPYSCDTCGMRFVFRHALRTHVLIHTDERPFSCNECGMSFKFQKELNTHKQKHTKPFSCDKCGESFALKPSLIVHKRIHTGERPFACTKCTKTFANPICLRSHIKSVHSEENEIHQCSICEKEFNGKSNLKSHVAFVHNAARRLKCTECDKKFKTRSALKTHGRSHSKPFRCDVCNKSFASISRLVGHMRNHTNEKPFACSVCSRRFQLQKSLRLHNENFCEFRKVDSSKAEQKRCKCCNKVYSSMANLRRHLNCKVLGFRFSCTQCSYTCALNGNLTRHVLKYHKA